MRRSSLALALVTSAAAFVAVSGSANAAGCGGYVNLMQWGCAPWDNNPPKAGVTPGYTAPPQAVISVPVAGPTTPSAAPNNAVPKDVQQEIIKALYYHNQITDKEALSMSSLVAGGGSIIAAGGGNLVGPSGGTLVSAGGGNLVGPSGGTLVSAGGGNLVGPSGGTLVSAGGGNYSLTGDAAKIVAAGGGNIVSAGGGNLVSAGGGNLVSAGGGNLVSAGGGNLVSAGGGNLVSAGGGNLVSAGGGNLVSAGGGNLVSAGGGNLVSAGGGNLVSAGGGNLVSAGGGNLVSAGGGNLVSAGGGNLVSAGGGNAVAQLNSLLQQTGAQLVSAGGGNLVSAGGGNLVSAGGGNLVSAGGGNLVSAGGGNFGLQSLGGDKVSKMEAILDTALNKPPAGFVPGGSAYTASGPTPAQIAAQKAMTDLQTASSSVTNASTAVLNANNQVDKYTTALALATKNNDQQQITLLNGELTTARKQLDSSNTALKVAGVALLANSTLVDPKDVPAATTLIGNTIAAVQKDSDVAKAGTASAQAAVAAATAPPAPSALQVATATAAAGKATDAATAAATANTAVQALVAKLGSRPANPDDLTKVNRAMAASAVTSAQSGLAKAQSDLVALSAKGGSNYDIQAQKDIVTKAQANVSYQTLMVANDYAGKHVIADVATTDLATAKAMVDGLTKAYGSNRPTDPAQNATITAAMVVQALAQDKADQTAADASAVRLIAQGASKNDIQVQQDLSAAKQKDMAGILKVNPQVLAAAGMAGSTDPALVTKAINGLVTNAAKQTSAAVQQTASAVQQTGAALLQAKLTPAASAPAIVVASGGDTASTLITSLKQTSSTLSNLSSGKPVAVTTAAPTLPGSTPPSAAPTNALALSSTQNPTGSGASPGGPPLSGPPSADLVTKFEAAVRANVSGANTPGSALAEKLVAGKVSAETMREFVSMTTGGTAMTPAAFAEFRNAQGKITNDEATLAAAKPAAAVVVATAPAAGATVAPAAPVAKTGEATAPAKLTADQGKTVQGALRTIPGNLTKPEEKSFAALSAMVDRATTKGLTPEEAVYLKEGLAALADKHKADKQAALTKIAVGIAPLRSSDAVSTGSPGSAPTIAVPAGNAAPGAKEALIQNELLLRQKDGVARKMDYSPPPVALSPDKQKALDTAEKKLGAKTTPAANADKAAPADAPDKMKTHSAPKQIAVVTKPEKLPAKPAPIIRGTPRIVAPATAQKLGAPVNKPVAAPRMVCGPTPGGKPGQTSCHAG